MAKTAPRRSSPLRDVAYHHLQTKLALGELPAGVGLSEIPLAQELGISRTPVREALNLLVAEGFLEQIPNRGTVVRQLGQRDIVELYELREALEVYAIGKVADTELTASQTRDLNLSVGAVEQLLKRLELSGQECLNAKEMRELASADLAFHNLILQLGGNGRILKVVSDTRLLIRIFALPHRGHDAGQLRDIHRYHKEIAEAIGSRNKAAAQRVLAQHIHVSMRERIDSHEAWEREQHMSRALSRHAGLNSRL